MATDDNASELGEEPWSTPRDDGDAVRLVRHDADVDDTSDAALWTRCNQLVAIDNIDKPAALSIQGLHHAMRTRLMQLQYEKDAEIATLRSEVCLQTVQRRHSEMVMSLSADLAKLTARVEEMRASLEEAHAAITQLGTVVPTGRRR